MGKSRLAGTSAALIAAAFVTSLLGGAPATAASALPVAPVNTSADPASAADMLQALNELRFAIGAPTIPADPRLDQAAHNHASYNVLNNTSGHYETAGKPGYTGYVAEDRAAAMGYRDSPWVSEVASSASDPLAGVRTLWDAPYHRLGLMHQHTYTVGWGRVAGGAYDRYQVVGNLAKDYGRSVPAVLRSPANGQRDIPTSWNGRESPSPVPAGTSAPYGYPIMITYSGARAVDLRGAGIAHNGVLLAFHVAPQVWSRDYAIITPHKPLPAGRIDVRFDLTVAGKPVTEHWSFSTVGAPAAPPPPPSPETLHAAWVAQAPWPTIAVGQTSTYSVTYRNTGTTTWTKGTASEARLGVKGDDRTFSNIGMAVGWPIPDRPAVQDSPSVPPGASTTFTFEVKGLAPGAYPLHLRPVVDGVTWMEDYGVYTVIAVR